MMKKRVVALALIAAWLLSSAALAADATPPDWLNTRPEDEAAVQALKTGLEQRERLRLEAALERLQELGTDCTGLGARAGIARPALWQRVQRDWADRFAELPVELQVQVTAHK